MDSNDQDLVPSLPRVDEEEEELYGEFEVLRAFDVKEPRQRHAEALETLISPRLYQVRRRLRAVPETRESRISNLNFPLIEAPASRRGSLIEEGEPMICNLCGEWIDPQHYTLNIESRQVYHRACDDRLMREKQTAMLQSRDQRLGVVRENNEVVELVRIVNAENTRYRKAMKAQKQPLAVFWEDGRKKSIKAAARPLITALNRQLYPQLEEEQKEK